ncbi:hypothetical protein AB0M95_40210 [Sphaerisporangium sp. NPDC051017]|uniref:hypothetical protein n=1 Tax=Sphaerisporangium sp. NPDC051017 TaxID=3154636 RepID=UPI00341C7096
MSDNQNGIDRSWKLSPTISLIRVGDEWLIEDPAQGSYRQFNTLQKWLSEALTRLVSGGTMTDEQVCEVLKKAGIPVRYVEYCLQSFLDSGVLVDATADPPPRDFGSLRDLQWATVSRSLDYRDPEAKATDIQLMYRYAQDDFPPASSTQAPETWTWIDLPDPDPDHGGGLLNKLGYMLYLVYGVHAEIHFGPLPRTRRTPPSFGASHPFDISVTTSAFSGERTAYYYQPAEHSLVALPATESDLSTDDPVLEQTLELANIDLAIHLAIERVHWRYRTSTAYPTVLLDLGHLTETLDMVADCMNVRLTVLAGRAEPPLAKEGHLLGPQLRRYRAQMKYEVD